MSAFQVRIKVDPYVASGPNYLTIGGTAIRDASTYYQNVVDTFAANVTKYDFTAAQIFYGTNNQYLALSDKNLPTTSGGLTSRSYFWDLVVGGSGNFTSLKNGEVTAPLSGSFALCRPEGDQSTNCLTGTYVSKIQTADNNQKTALKTDENHFVVYDLRASSTVGTGTDDTYTEGAAVKGNRYFAIGGTQIQGGTGVTGLPGVTAGDFSVTRYIVTNGLGNFSTGSTLESQAAALTVTGSSSDRIANTAFRPEATFVSGARGDTQLLITSSPTAGANPFLRADVQLNDDSGLSSISVATGNVARLSTDGSLALSGNMVGSYRSSATSYSTAISSPLGSIGTDNTSTAAHLYGTNATTGAKIGYLGLSQVNPAANLSTYNPTAANLQQGTGTKVNYAFSRLAVGVSATNADATPSADVTDANFETAKRLTASQTVTGYAAGVVESTASEIYGVTTSTESSNTPSNARIALDPGNNTVAANLTLAPDRGGSSFTLSYGGTTAGQSAYVSNSVFGAINTSSGTSGGLVSVGADLKAGIDNPASVQSGIGTINGGNSLCDCAYAQWGFFFGDVSNNGSTRERINLGTWVIGKPTDPTTLPTTGTATYFGHMIGTAVDVNGGNLRDRVGSFKNAWDFGTRSGALAASFDGANYTGTLNGAGTTAQFGGSVNNGGTRTMNMQGSFFGPVTAGSPPEMGGQFSIKAGDTYRAQGTFLGKR